MLDSSEVWLAGRVIGIDLSLLGPEAHNILDALIAQGKYPTLQGINTQVNGEFFEWTDGPEVSNDELIERTKQIVNYALGPDSL